jgi:hypothetical protein
MNRYKRLGLANKKTIFWAYTKPEQKDAYASIQWILAHRKN